MRAAATKRGIAEPASHPATHNYDLANHTKDPADQIDDPADHSNDPALHIDNPFHANMVAWSATMVDRRLTLRSFD